MITNSVDEAILLSDRIVPLSRGPKATLGPSIPVPHDVDADSVRARVVEYLTGFASTAGESPERDGVLLPRSASHPSELGTMIRPLEITGLGKTFFTPEGPFTTVRDFNLLIRPGEFICLLGHSGCGKSTVLSILAGLHRHRRAGFVSMERRSILRVRIVV
jgi:nitrate/nitrite transport system ATP-binding protein